MTEPLLCLLERTKVVYDIWAELNYRTPCFLSHGTVEVF